MLEGAFKKFKQNLDSKLSACFSGELVFGDENWDFSGENWDFSDEILVFCLSFLIFVTPKKNINIL